MRGLLNIDRRLIYLFVIVALAYPLLNKFSIRPAQMKSADKFYELVSSTKPEAGKFAFVALDFGPSTAAENAGQAEVVIEHLMRRRIPVALFSQYLLAEPFLKNIPTTIKNKLELEMPGETWVYGKDWVNLGFKPGSGILIQSLSKAKDLSDSFLADAYSTPLKELPLFSSPKSLKDISLLAQFTGLVGVFDSYVQFFQTAEYKPNFGHGCTSITIPEAYIYLDSGQLNGLLEGIAGAAWYSRRLSIDYPNRTPDEAILTNTGLGIAHLLLIGLIILGNISALVGRRSK